MPPLTEAKAKREKSPVAKNSSIRGQHQRSSLKGTEIVRKRLSIGIASNSPPADGRQGGSRNDRTTSREHADVSPDVVERDLPNSIHKSKITNQKMPDKKLMIKSTSQNIILSKNRASPQKGKAVITTNKINLN